MKKVPIKIKIYLLLDNLYSIKYITYFELKNLCFEGSWLKIIISNNNLLKKRRRRRNKNIFIENVKYR